MMDSSRDTHNSNPSEICKIILLILLLQAITLQMLGVLKVPTLHYVINDNHVISAARLISQMNESVDPCDDFYEFACGRWNNNHPLTEDVKQIDQFQILEDAYIVKIKEILEAKNVIKTSFSFWQAQNLYSGCMDEAKLDKLGVEPLLQTLRSLGLPQVPIMDSNEQFSLQKALINTEKILGDSIFFSLDVTTNPLHKSKKILQVIPDSYNDLPRTWRVTRKVLEGFIADFIKLLAKHIPGTVVDVKLMARHVYTLHVKLRTLAYNLSANQYQQMSFDELQKLTDSERSIQNNATSFNWRVYLEEVLKTKRDALTGKGIVVRNKKYFKGLSHLLLNTKPKIVELYVWWRVISALAPYTTSEFGLTKRKLWSRISGRSLNTPRWKTCAKLSIKYFRSAIETEYAKKHNTNTKRQKILEWVDTIKRNYVFSVLHTSDVYNTTNFKEHFGQFKTSAEFSDWLMLPDHIQKFDGLQLVFNSKFFESHINILTAMASIKMDTVSQMLPEKNAPFYDDASKAKVHYDPHSNVIEISPSILEPPFYDLANEPITHGAIGTLISREISQALKSSIQVLGIDLQWLKGGTTEAGLSDQDDNHAYTIALRHALLLIYRVWQRSTDDEISCFPSYSAKQFFFLGFANMWCSNASPSVTEPSTGRSRVIGTLSQMEEFAEAWNCPSGSKMNPS